MSVAQAQGELAEAEAEAIEEVIVTGSYIKGTQEDAPNLISILDRDELFKQGSPQYR